MKFKKGTQVKIIYHATLIGPLLKSNATHTHDHIEAHNYHIEELNHCLVVSLLGSQSRKTTNKK
jgi:hypothetical protein